MSGGVGPPCDITLPKEPEPAHKPAAAKTRSGPNRIFSTFGQLNALAVAVVLSATGMVAAEDVSFVVFSLLYFLFISRVAFPPIPSQADPGPDPKSPVLTLYALAGLAIGLVLPIAYICEGVYEGDKEGIRAAAPHVFLLASQVFVEGVTVRFSSPVRVLVTVVYNSMRMLCVVEWVKNEVAKAEAEDGGSWRRVAVGRGLAVANMAYWSFNLFGYLLPFYMPKAFKMYYSKVNKD